MSGRQTRNKSQTDQTDSIAKRKLMASLENAINTEELYDQVEFEKGDIEVKLDQIVNAMDKINDRFTLVHNIINDASDGLDIRIDTNIDSNRDNAENMEALQVENKQLRQELDLVKGLLFKYDEEVITLRNQITTLTARSMSNNVVVTGITGDAEDPRKENCKEKSIAFLKKTMKLEVDNKHLQVAHRIGQFNPESTTARPMVMRCHPTLKAKILAKRTSLKDITNEEGAHYYVNKQIPDQWAEENRERREQIRTAKDKAQQVGQNVDIKIQNRVVYVNHQPIRKFLEVPKPRDLFVDKQEQEKIDKIKTYHSDEYTKKGSSFTAHAVKCSSMTEVRRAYIKMKQLYPDATHIPTAYIIKNGEGYQDDREHSASSKMLNVLKNNDIQNLAVFVVRYYGGIHLGPTRHQMIQDAIIEVIAKLKTGSIPPVSKSPKTYGKHR